MVALAALILTACSDKQTEMFNLIPKTTKAVLKMKPIDLAKKANLEKLNLKKMDAGVLQNFKDFFNGNMGVSPEQLVVFEYENKPWAMFEETDESKLKDALKNAETKSVNGCTVYKNDDWVIAVKDGLGWTTDSRNIDKIAETANAFSKLQESEAISSLNSFANHMTGNDINVYVNIKSIYDSEMTSMDEYAGMVKNLYGPYINSDMYISADFGKNDLTVKSKVLDANGKNVMETMNLKNVDKDILKFFNEKSTLVAAVNMPEEYIKFLDAVIAAGAGNDPMTGNIAKTITSSLEGNIAIGAYLKNGSNYYANDYAIAVKLKEGGADKLKGLIDGMIPGMMDGNGNLTIPTGYGFNVNVSFEDDYLLATNSEKPSGSATYATSPNASRFNDCYSALMLDMPTGSVLSGMATMATGADLSGYLYAGSGKDKNELVWHVNNNPESNTLALILKIISDMQ